MRIACLVVVLGAWAGGVASAEEDLYVCDFIEDHVVVLESDTLAVKRVFIPRGGGYLCAPRDVAIGPDHRLYVASTGSDEIRRYRADGTVVELFVPAGRGGLTRPIALEFGPDGHLYVLSDWRLMRFDGESGAPLGGSGEPDDATLISAEDLVGNPMEMAFGPDGDLYLAGWGSRVMRCGLDGSFKGFFVDSDANAGMWAATGLAFGPDGRLYVSSYYTDEIKVFHGPGNATPGTPVGNGTFVSAESGGPLRPRSLIFLPGGKLVVSSEVGNELKFYGTAGQLTGSYSSDPIRAPHGLALDASGRLYVAGKRDNQILRIDGYTAPAVPHCPDEGRQGGLNSPFDLAFARIPPINEICIGQGDLYVSCYDSREVKIYSRSAGVYLRTFVSEESGLLERPTGIAFSDATGDLYVTDYTARAVKVFKRDTGAFKGAIDTGFVNPQSIIFAPKWHPDDDPKGYFYVAGPGSSQILRIDGSTHALTTVSDYSGPETLRNSDMPCRPKQIAGLAWNSPFMVAGGEVVSGTLLVADRVHQAVRRFYLGDMSCSRASLIQVIGAGPPSGLLKWDQGIYVAVSDADSILCFESGTYLSQPIAAIQDEGLLSAVHGMEPGPVIGRAPMLVDGRWGFFDKLRAYEFTGETAVFSPPEGAPSPGPWLERMRELRGERDPAFREVRALLEKLPADEVRALQHKLHLIASLQAPERPDGPPESEPGENPAPPPASRDKESSSFAPLLGLAIALLFLLGVVLPRSRR